MINSKKQTFIVIGVFVLILLLGTTTYAFFNYTRTGGVNAVRTGQINFNATQGQAINLTNMFPIDVSEGIPNNPTKVGTLTINVTGNTTYASGLEYLVSAVNVENTTGSGENIKTVPISIDVSVTGNTNNSPATTLGTSDENYFSNRGSTTSCYKILANDVIEDDGPLAVGYIAPGATGVDGNIVIRAYLDINKIAISDTYDESNPGTANMGTTSEWVDNRVILTTTEWNALQTNGVSFQIMVESNEGTWAEDPVIPVVESCPNCRFFYSPNTDYYTTWNGSNTASQITTDLYDDYRVLIREKNVNYFFGLILNENNQATNVYACRVKKQNPNSGKVNCVEGVKGLANSNVTALQNAGYSCRYESEYGTTYCYNGDGNWGDTEFGIKRSSESNGYVIAYDDEANCGCSARYDGRFDCFVY